MAFARDDAPSVTARADALVINTGTLNDEFIHAIPKSLTIAEKSGIPVVLDPVGTGLSDYRAHFVSELLSHYHIDVLRCNSAELFSLCGRSAQARGIDGALDTLDPPEITSVVMEAAQKYGCTIACTGAVDYISDGSKTLKLSRGSSLLPKLVGTGCTVNSLIGAAQITPARRQFQISFSHPVSSFLNQFSFLFSWPSFSAPFAVFFKSIGGNKNFIQLKHIFSAA